MYLVLPPQVVALYGYGNGFASLGQKVILVDKDFIREHHRTFGWDIELVYGTVSVMGVVILMPFLHLYFLWLESKYPVTPAIKGHETDIRSK